MDKLKERQSRFGGSTESPLLKSLEHLEKLKQRQARFGVCESSTLQAVEEAEKMEKRASKFGIVLNEQESEEEDRKRQIRLARFQSSIPVLKTK